MPRILTITIDLDDVSSIHAQGTFDNEVTTARDEREGITIVTAGGRFDVLDFDVEVSDG